MALAEPYWASIDLKSVGAFTVAVGGVAFPFLKAWWDGRVKIEETAARSAESQAERAERISRENYDRVCVERDYLEKQAREADRRRREVENESDLARANARGMDDWAHWYRHGWANVASRFRALTALMQGVVDGTLAMERVTAILDDIKLHPPVDPPLVPLLQDAAGTRPPSN